MTDLSPEGRARLRKAADVYQNERSELVRRDAAQEMAQSMPALLDLLARAERVAEAARVLADAAEGKLPAHLDDCYEALVSALAEYDGRE